MRIFCGGKGSVVWLTRAFLFHVRRFPWKDGLKSILVREHLFAVSDKAISGEGKSAEWLDSQLMLFETSKIEGDDFGNFVTAAECARFAVIELEAGNGS